MEKDKGGGEAEEEEEEKLGKELLKKYQKQIRNGELKYEYNAKKDEMIKSTADTKNIGQIKSVVYPLKGSQKDEE